MKYTLLVFLLLLTQAGYAEDKMKSFNQVLIEKVQKDIAQENDHQFQKKPAKGRSPASVGVPHQAPAEKKLDKVHRQIGSHKW